MEIVSSGEKPKRDVELRRFCDDQGGGTLVDFYRKFIFNGQTGATISVEDVDQDGAPYTVIGTAIECPPSGFDIEKKLLCDNQGGGVKTEFIRSYVYNPTDGSIVSTSDSTLAGGAYTVLGTVEECKPDQICYDFNGRQSLAVTDALALNLTVPANTEYAEIQVIGGNIAFTIDGATTPTNTGSAGNVIYDCGFFKLGCGDGDNLGDPAEVTDFEVIALAGTTPRLEVNYFAKA